MKPEIKTLRILNGFKTLLKRKLPLPIEITVVEETRKVLFEKYSPKVKIINLFLELWDSCTIRGIGGDGATTVYLIKNNSVLFEFNRVVKKIFLADHILIGLWFQIPGVDKNQVDRELINEAISHAIKQDLKIDINYDYQVDRLGDYSSTELWDFVQEHSIEVSFEHLFLPVPHIDEIVENIINNTNKADGTNL
jgi:hypothetical protein